ncbi:MAG: CHAT domain-containing protein [Acidobacteria bacterium]|nr:CHAT domain-containing protein [Acidobacteriota bacterium]
MANTTAILSVLKTPAGKSSWRHSGLLTFETEALGNSDEEFLRFVPAFFNANFDSKIRSLQSRIAILRTDYVEYMGNYETGGQEEIIQRLIQELKDIGEFIFHKFECKRIFDELFSKQTISNLVIYTNDPSIPWQWAYDSEKDVFACERFAMGKIFMQEVNKGRGDQLQSFVSRNKQVDKNGQPLVVLQDKSALILVGDWPGHINEIPKAAREGDLLKSTFRQKRFGEVKLIKGNDVQFSEALRVMADKLKIIHYSGHSSEKGLLPTPDAVLSPHDIFENPRALSANPVVFLNSCLSGVVKKIWEQEASLATAFLASGACGCVVTSLPVSDIASEKFAIAFYEMALKGESAPSIGEIVRLIRIEQAQDEEIKNDLTRLFFDYYGDPRTRLEPSRIHTIRREQTSTYKDKRIYQKLKSTLK